MSKSLKLKVDELAERFSVVRGSMNADQFRSAVKAKAGYPDESIEVIYDKVFNASAAVDAPSGPVSPDTPGTVTVLPPLPNTPPTATRESGYGHPVSVYITQAAPAVSPNVLGHGSHWSSVAPSIAAWFQTLALGLVVGVLISKPILKLLGH